jgi:hypothetical protein
MIRSISLAARLAAVVLATAAAGLAGAVTASPASAATCSSGSGVSVVVDFGGLGGGVRTDCAPDGAGKSASSLFSGAGYDLAYVQNEPGFVCRVDNLPSPSDQACVNTPPESAYWSLWWSDGTSGSWSYSNYGVGSLKVPDGAYVGFAWVSGSKSPPGVPAATHASSPTPTPSAAPTVKPSTGGGGGGGGGNGGGNGGNGGGGGSSGSHGSSSSPSVRPASPSTSPTASETQSANLPASPSASPTKAGGRGGKGGSPSGTPTPSSSVLADATTDATTDAATPSVAPEAGEVAASSQGSALPIWVVPAVILILGVGASAAYVKRRRDRPSP